MNDLLAWFDREFDRLDANWRKLIGDLNGATFYSAPKQEMSPAAEQILRSARIVEQIGRASCRERVFRTV